LRLLLPTQPYAACKGGATLLRTYPGYNETTPFGLVSHPTDYVQNWQVCIN
jgi:hypothetical protein